MQSHRSSDLGRLFYSQSNSVKFEKDQKMKGTYNQCYSLMICIFRRLVGDNVIQLFYIYIITKYMVKLSSYSNGYDDGKFELMPWEFWTEEQRSQVIHNAYKDHYLTSKDVKSYLDISRRHMVTQFIVPIVAGVGYFGFAKNTFAKNLYRKCTTTGNIVGAAFVGATTLLWLNLSPFYISKENGQEKVLDALYHKLGPSMKLLNELIPRTRTSTDIDIRTRMLYSQRNGFLAGTVFPEEDHTPPVLNKNITHSYESKKIFL